jgi:plastocyanin
MRKLLALSLALALFAALGGHAFARTTKTIKVGDDFFVRKGKPPTATVSRGTKVVFRWAKGASLHNVHGRKGPATFRSSFRHNGSFSRVLTRPGTYRIVCDIHQPSMRMTIKVR